jgi:hypothetical protein
MDRFLSVRGNPSTGGANGIPQSLFATGYRQVKPSFTSTSSLQ